MTFAYSPLVLSANALFVVPLVILALLFAVIYILRWILKASYDIEKKEPYKKIPFESSNPPRGVGKARVPFQYFGYLIMFLTVEPAVVILTFIATSPHTFTFKSILFYVIMVVIFTPLLAYAAHESKRIKEWILG